MKLVKSKQIANNTIKQQNFNITFDSIVNDTDVTNKQFVDESINSKVAKINFAQLNQDMNALSTSSSTLACDKYIIEYPISELMVRVNGVEVSLGDTGSTYDCYFSSDNGVTANTPPQKGDYLYWNPTSFYQLENDDEIDFEFLVNYQYIYAVAGSSYTFNQKFDNSVIKYVGANNTNSTLIVSSSTFIFGNVGGQFVFDIGGPNEHTFTYVGENYTLRFDGYLYTINWDGFGSLIFSVEKQRVYDLIFDILLPDGDTTFTLPIVDGYNYNFKVNWNGEGNSTVKSFTSPNITHTFATAGIKTISLIGKCEAFDTRISVFGTGFTNDGYKILGLNEFNGDMNLKQLSFGNCINLSAVSFTNLPVFNSTTSVSNLFNGCEALPTIPSTIFASNTGITDFSFCFANCSLLDNIGSDLFSGNTLATTFSNTFYKCNTLSSIPIDLFTYNINVTDFSFCFGYTNITSVPTNLFTYNTNVTTFSGCFYYCFYLTTIPSTLFNTNVNVTDFSNCFVDCIALSSGSTLTSHLFDNNINVTTFNGTFINCKFSTIPTDFFKFNTLVTDFSNCFGGCNLLDIIPSNIFNHNTNVTSFSNCFYGCAITAITNAIFDLNTLVTDFSYCFANCQGLKTMPTDIFRHNTAVTTFSGCFSNCIQLNTIPVDIFRYNTLVTDISFCFYGCLMPSLPVDIFRYNTAVLDFSDCFYNCPQLRSIPNNLFYYNSNVLSYSGVFSNCSHIALPAVIFNTSYLNTVTDFSFFMEASATSNSNTGSIQPIWNFANVTADKTSCFTNQTSLTVQGGGSIPLAWR